MPEKRENKKTLSVKKTDTKSSSGIKSLSEIMAELDNESKLEYSAHMHAFLKKSGVHTEITEKVSQKDKKPQE
jgi:hypothetical protein